jgi:hypothetical protein
VDPEEGMLLSFGSARRALGWMALAASTAACASGSTEEVDNGGAFDDAAILPGDPDARDKPKPDGGLNAEVGGSPGEICGDGLDNNGDGFVDEGCPCTLGTTQKCYPGGSPPKGQCIQGEQVCEGPPELARWSACKGAILPAAETCNGIDDNCDGTVDEGCECVGGAERPCGIAIAPCKQGTQRCESGKWGSCLGATDPGTETCNGVDDDCNGTVDDIGGGGVCECKVGEEADCDGNNKGICKPGRKKCDANGKWGACEGRVEPTTEICGNNLDDDCNGSVDDAPGCDTCGKVCAFSECEIGQVDCSSGTPTCQKTGNQTAGTTCTGGVCDGKGVCVPCVVDKDCQPTGSPNAECKTGKTDCKRGFEECIASGDKPGGTSCTGGVCNGSGVCGACRAGEACTIPGNECVNAVIDCSSGVEVCKATTPKAPGTICTGGVCNGSGACTPCVEDQTCALPGEECKNGRTTCSSGAPVCVYKDDKATGIPCTGGVCNTGVCVPCSPGAACDTGNQCTNGRVSCGTGAPVCNYDSNKPAGTTCTGGVCNTTGACTSCTAGANCQPPNPCATGAIACGTGAPICTPTGVKPAGTSCGANKVCNAGGSCVDCTEGASCTTGNQCQSGTVTCGTGTPVCVPSNRPAGSACTGGVCNGAGVCNACVQGAACNFGNSECSNGTTQCQSGAPVCAFVSHKPAGSGCAGGAGVCNGSGACVPCAQGAVCNAGECNNGAITCNTGGPVCTVTGSKPVNTACSGGGRCNGLGQCGRCGDGIIDRTLGEECDGGDGSRCDGACKVVCSGFPNSLGTFKDVSTGKCYWRTDRQESQSNFDNNRCRPYGGTLAYLETVAEKNAVYDGLVRFSSASKCWIGLTRVAANTYRWQNGVPLNYTPVWRGSNQDCVSWWHDNGNYGQFAIESCGERRDGICERNPLGTPR